mmetsp:Transcript_22118/g.48542  ORF Transcript_22118/g.48542 Transcript_22118/m.48542 type:complete len:157 (-) Transcript_22118:297-767(-)|eukprot:CAMPEP_0118932364 /NCGR_PEP_ID=MMETSP1169-20130426/10015_1 /TAXON_ID=36882 /ORGANISM="Pyramimonas obovata, Strain CCMP722" /LENGTH=156 /DNA_ID=CAMNT_0006875013 /DNA_START=132 /DNA_END=602 /DNA_ORIENTATION=+
MVKVGNVELSEAELQEFKEVFELVDTDGGGSIEAPEVRDLMVLLGMRPSLGEVEAMIKEIDIDGNGEVDFEEFIQVMAGQQKTSYTKSELLRAFRLFQDHKLPKGFIHPDALVKHLLTYCSDKVTPEDVAELVGQLQTTADGLINFEERVDIFMSG